MGRRGPKRKEIPPKPCQWCGKMMERRTLSSGRLEDAGAFGRRRYCGASCSAKRQHAVGFHRPPLGEAPSVAASRKRAKKFMLDACEACGIDVGVLDIHHVDGNPFNNDPVNLQTLCKGCHGFWHRLLGRLGQQPRFRMPRLFPPPDQSLVVPPVRADRGVIFVEEAVGCCEEW